MPLKRILPLLHVFTPANLARSPLLQSAQLAPLIREFDLGDEAVAAATAGDMEAFVKALQKKSKDDDKKDEPEDMALD